MQMNCIGGDFVFNSRRSSMAVNAALQASSIFLGSRREKASALMHLWTLMRFGTVSGAN